MKTVIIVSGGMDSITLLHEIYQTITKDIDVLSFDYGSKHNRKEIPCAKYHAEKLGLKHIVIPLTFMNGLFKSSLLASGDDIPEGHYADENMKSTVVPFRNGIMLSIAVGYAESVGASLVYLGSHYGDHAIYPDCREKFTAAMSKAAKLGTYKKVGIISPYKNLMKWDIVKRGTKLGVEYARTWSCYKGLDKPCGRCGTCVERKEAFEKAGIADNIEYMEE